MTKRVVPAIALCLALLADPATAHRIGSETTGSEMANVPSVENCTMFAWTEKRRCSTYDTTNHHWEVTNNCPRDVNVIWADNGFDRPIRRNANSGKPRSESKSSLRPDKVLKRDVGCVDKAELEICIEYSYPPLREHAENCDEFFD